MIKNFFIVYFFLFPLLTYCQHNLVPNGDFEGYDSIPIGLLNNNIKIENYLHSWIRPTDGTPDYFHKNSNSFFNSVPYQTLSFNGRSYQNYLNNKGGFCGFNFAYNSYYKSIRNEYIQIKFNLYLTENKKYLLNFKIAAINFPQFILNTIGVHFSADSIRQYYSNSYEYPNWSNFATRYVADYYVPIEKYASTDWVENEYIFRANGSERWLTIGNFWQAGQYDSLYDPTTDTIIFSYYFIDDVSLIEIPCLVGQDTACKGEQVTFYSTFSGPFEWRHKGQLLSTDSIYSFIAEEGWYYLKTPFGEDSLYLHVVDDLPRFEDINEQICKGESTEIQLLSQFKYQWQDGSQASHRNFSTPAYQWVAVASNHCTDTFKVAVKVQPIPLIEIQRSFQFCKDSIMGIEVYLPSEFQYLWTDGLDGSYRLLTSEGMYSFNIYDSLNCSSMDSIEIAERCPMKIFMPNAFAPEGINKVFRPLMNGVELATLVIFNRWGEKIYEETSAYPSWNGTYQGQKCMQGVYHYQLEVEQNNNKQYFSGVVHLVR